MCCMNRGRSCYGSCNCSYAERCGLIPYNGHSCGGCNTPVQIGYNMYLRCGCWYYPVCSGCNCINAGQPSGCNCGSAPYPSPYGGGCGNSFHNGGCGCY